MQSIALQTYELKDLIREAVSEALYLDIRAVSDDELSVSRSHAVRGNAYKGAKKVSGEQVGYAFPRKAWERGMRLLEVFLNYFATQLHFLRKAVPSWFWNNEQGQSVRLRIEMVRRDAVPS